MPPHHPGTSVVQNKLDITNVPRALTTHLLSIQHEQLLRATQHPFLARAAQGTLSKKLAARWLAEDELYLGGLTRLTYTLLNQVRSQHHAAGELSSGPSIESRLIVWLKSALEKERREAKFVKEVAEIYKLDIKNTPLTEDVASEGLRQFAELFSTISSQEPKAFIPWLEGVVVIWATEKVYYEAWSWARRQDKQSYPRTFRKDQDEGAMRREFIPNWSSRGFLSFVEQIERILNEGVSQAVNKEDERWSQVKTRTDAIWKEVLDAEEAFWPDVSGKKDEELNEAVFDNDTKELNDHDRDSLSSWQS